MLKPRSRAGKIGDTGPEPQDTIARASPPPHPVQTNSRVERQVEEIKRAVFASPIEVDPAAGTPVEVEWGNELFQPLAYHGFNTGAFKARTVVRAGESAADAVYRLWLELNEVAMRIRDEKAAEYLREVERLAAKVNAR